MDYQLPNEVKIILDKFIKANYRIYIVGGAVRDLIMGRKVKDWDFTTDAPPEEILKLFPESFYDNKFGTVGIPVKNTSEVYEITTMRKEGKYGDFRHPEQVKWTDKIEEDLARRDFTINAIALRLTSLSQGKPSGKGIVDPFGGCQDIEAKIIKAVGDPDKRFKEDALRLMRAIRIATELGFEIAKNTFKSIQKNAELIKEISSERIRDELFKLLASPYGYIGIKLLREAGILSIILPELEKTFGVSQKGPKHVRTYDIGEHSLLTLKETPSSDPLVKIAALLHDIGKPNTMKITEDGNVTFYHHEVVGGALVLKIAKRLHLSKKQTYKLFRLVRWHLFTVDEKQTDSAIRRFIKNVGVENIEDMMALRVGDRVGGGTQKAVSWRMEKFRERIDQVLQKPFSISDLKVNGKDVMETLGITPGPKVGEVLQKLFEEVLEDASKNNREYLLEKIKLLK